MARFSRIEVALKMKETGIVPVFFHKDLEICKQVVKACYEGGVRVFEYTNRGDYAHEIFSELNKFAEKETPEMIMGVGSINEPGTASLYMQLGANFIVSPVLNPEMAKVCNRRKVSWSPGCGSLSEISYAEELGAEVVKIFPGTEVGGPSFVKGVKAPHPWTSIMPTGGVSPTQENLSAWFNAGVHCVGMGSKLITKEIIAEKDFAGLTEKVKEAIDIVKSLRK
ncbi:bifunctional 4-hydroxy-2-oxoglutarate aldolase/2-dehydro-3-deoxy-phosphogluconate aldolase [Catalinimonas sp. 4WD22]|uniref:bifunctional 4-hydroxy-2-oxoglutarate aldolase/2-dehydro-3-deoxy-phosphogluconate aldolase n=1 Tax=Catalinimonas locisalis TaxID=3133978 RepID=UPI0031017AD4